MRLKSFLGLVLVLALASAGVARGQSDGEQSFGVFHASCRTDQMTDARSCMINAHPDASFFVENRDVLIFMAFFYPDETNVSTSGFVRRLRVDKNPPLVGDCMAISSGPCSFKDKKENERFLKEMETGTTLHLEAGSRIFDYDLADYKKALAAYNEMKRPATPAASPK